MKYINVVELMRVKNVKYNMDTIRGVRKGIKLLNELIIDSMQTQTKGIRDKKTQR